MAHKDTIQNPTLKSMFGGAYSFYNLHGNVGYGYKNNYGDVMLIQYFLNVARKSVGAKRIEEDGDFGGKTWAAIKNFQRCYKTVYVEHGNDGSEYNLHVDGMVNASKGPNFLSPKTRSLYTIFLLNLSYWATLPQYFKDIRHDPGLPKPLVSHLSTP